MITRQQYLNGDFTHEEYYDQFVTEALIQFISTLIGIDRIVASKEDSFNDIPLREWSVPVSDSLRDLYKKCGDSLSLSGLTCIAKATARRIKYNNPVRVICYHNRQAEIFNRSNDCFEVQPVIGDTVSRSFPFKEFKTLNGAVRYAQRFIDY